MSPGDVLNALNFLIQSRIVEEGFEMEYIQDFSEKLERMQFVPIVTTVNQAPLSCSSDEILDRLKLVDSSADSETANAFLAYEEDIRDAVYLIQRAGRRDERFAGPILKRGKEVTNLLVTQAEAFLKSPEGKDWNAKMFFARIAQSKPSHPDLLHLLKASPPDFAGQLKSIADKGNMDG